MGAVQSPLTLFESSSLSLFNGMQKFGGDERRVSRRCAVRICWVVGYPEGGLGATDIDERDVADGEAGDGRWEEMNCRCATVSFARSGMLVPLPEVSEG